MDQALRTTLQTRRWAGCLALAVLLGLSLGWSSAPAWAAGLCVLAAVTLGVLRPVGAPGWALALVLLLLTATAGGALTGERRLEAATLAVSSALAHAAAVALPVGLVTLARRRRRHRSQGWDLARSLAREEQARTETALTRERAAMAGEIHDSLGHRLTLVSVQLGRLGLDPDLPPDARTAVEEARQGVAEAAADLGETVQLLKSGAPSRSPADRSLSGILEEARDAGLSVEGVVPAAVDRGLSAPAHAALARVLSEALANAAKHAPGQPARVQGRITDGRAVLTVSNTRGTGPEATAPSSGHGLPALRHRLALLGGVLQVEDGAEHVLRATVPVDASPRREDEAAADPLTEVRAAEEAADHAARRLRRLTWAVPTALAAGAVVVTLGGLLYISASSTLSADEFARIEVGMPQDEAEDLLPRVEMLEAPRTSLPEPEGARCTYHEEAFSPFVRHDVFRVCFDDGVVVRTDTIRAEGS